MYTVTCESTCDLPFYHLQKRKCNVIFYTYTVDGVEYLDDMWRTPQALPDLYQNLKSKHPRTSQINVQTYEDFFAQQIAFGDVLHIAFSSGLSQSVNNAKLAAQKINEQNHLHKVVVVDSLCGGGGYGLFVEGVLDQRDKGMGFFELCKWATEHRQNVRHFFFSTDLTYFRRSGRVSGPAMLIGNLLHLCPVMHVNAAGKIVAYAKIVSVKKAVNKLVDEVLSHAQGGQNYDGKMVVQHSNCFATAFQTKTALAQKFANVKDIPITDVGTVMACHCGPNTVAVYFWGVPREE